MDLVNPHFLEGEIDGKDVSHFGTLLCTIKRGTRLCVITNPSSKGMYLAFKNSPDGTTCQAVVGKGIYCPSNGGGYEMSPVNIGQTEVWAIHDDANATHRMCIQLGE